MAIVRYQQDAYFRDYRRSDGLTFDVNWTGKWEIQDANATMVANGVAALSGDSLKMEFRIKDTDTSGLLGAYTIIFEITNTATGFQREFAESITFLAQSIT